MALKKSKKALIEFLILGIHGKYRNQNRLSLDDIIKKMKSIRIYFVLSVTITFTVLLIFPVNATPLAQLTPFPTPTPGPDGKIIYTVQPGDTLLRISLIAGISVDELRGLNNLTGDSINAGDKILLGLGGPSQVTPTLGPSPTATPVVPTPTPKPGAGNLCILLYEDQNGNAIREETEVSIPGGAISINDRLGKVSKTTPTVEGTDPTCFQNLPEGEYSISVAIPDGYNPTTSSSYVVKLGAGDETYLDFGAQKNTAKLAEAPTPTGSGPSPLLGIVGGLFLLAGIGMAVFGTRLMRGK